MNRFLIDLSNVLGVMSHRGVDSSEFTAENGDTVRTWEHSYSQFLTAYKEALTITETAPRQTIAVLDAQGSRRRRQRIHAGYKAHRTPKSHEYYAEFDTLKKQVLQFLKELGATIVFAKGYEADDTIVHIAQNVSDCVVWSTDRDLSIPEVVIYNNGSMGTNNPYLEGMDRKYIPLYRTLVGDTGDFGPGTSCKGFGKKAFLDLFHNSTDEQLDSLCYWISEGKTEECGIQKIVDSKEMVELTWKLSNWFPISYYRLKWDVGYAHDISCATFDDDFLEFYQEVSLVTAGIFSDDLKKMIRNFAEEAPYISLDVETSDCEESQEWIARMKKDLKKDKTSVDFVGSTLTGLSITVGGNLQYTYYFPVDHKDTDNIDSQKLRDFILSLENDFIAHNSGGAELPILKQAWDAWLPNCFCSLIAANYVNENRFSHQLKNLSKDYLGYEQQTYKEVTQGRRMNELTGEEVLQYGCDDTITAGYLMNHFITIMQLEGSFDTYIEVERDAAYMVASSFYHGIDTDLDVIKSLEAPDKAAYDFNYKILTNYFVKHNHPSVIRPEIIELTAKEIKKAYLAIHREPFKCQVRLIDKVIGKLPEGEFKTVFETKDLKKINLWLIETWQPHTSFKPGSPKEVGSLLYDFMEFPVKWRSHLTKDQRKKGQTEGNRSSDGDSIKWAIKYDCNDEQEEVLNALIRCKQYQTRHGLYYKPYPYLTHWKTGKLHPNLRQSNTTSRRFAPASPNVNQIPKRSEEGKKIRRCIVPHKKDAVIVAPDFSSQELRHTAEESQDENFLACYLGENLKDLHWFTAFEICQKQGKEFSSYEEMKNCSDIFENLPESERKKQKTKGSELYKSAALAKDYRGNKAKATNFLASYISIGGGVDTLSKKLQISSDDAEKFLAAKSDAFPGVDLWKTEYTDFCRKSQLAFTKLGVPKHLHELLIRGYASAVFRSAVNFRIQSSSAEQTKLVMCLVWLSGMMERYDVRFYFSVHDELVFSVVRKHLTAFCKELRPLMETQYAGMVVPCKSSLAVGPNFGQLSEIDWDKTDEWLFDQQMA